MAKSWFKKLKGLDLFPKSIDEVFEKSSAGAAVSVIGTIVLIILLIFEFGDYFSSYKSHNLFVNHNRGEKMNINFRITFLALPCDAISFDVTDRLGEEQVGVQKKHQQVAMIPWKGDFWKVKDELMSITKSNQWTDYHIQNRFWVTLRKYAITNSNKECLPCYDATTSERQCCNTCWDLAKAYVERGLDTSQILNYTQCQNTPEKYGCMVSGWIEVNKVQGSFHIAVGDTHSEPGQKHHHHWDIPYRNIGFNTTHHIAHLSFGQEYPDLVNPLDGFLYSEPGVGQQQYFLQIVPTTYVKSSGRSIQSNQYSVTYQYSPVDTTQEHFELPGVFFKYDISPIAIRMSEEQKSFGHFITRIFAVVGGIWVVIGLLYRSIKGSVEVIVSKKRE